MEWIEPSRHFLELLLLFEFFIRDVFPGSLNTFLTVAKVVSGAQTVAADFHEVGEALRF